MTLEDFVAYIACRTARPKWPTCGQIPANVWLDRNRATVRKVSALKNAVTNEPMLLKDTLIIGGERQHHLKRYR
jgi:hypothetical protein